MEKIVKVGTMPGRLQEVVVEGTETVAEVFEMAGIELLDGYEIKADGNTVDLSSNLGNANLLIQVKMIKGNK